jgi:oligoendopeptidase F
MIKNLAVIALLSMVWMASGRAVMAEDRSQIPEKYTWNLKDMYATPEAWAAGKDALAKRIPELDKFKGHLGDSPEALYQALSTLMDMDKELSKLMSYASQLYDQDTRVSKSQEMAQSVEQVAVQFGAAASFLRPEILALDKAKVEGFVASDPRLKEYKPFLEDILRWQPHTLTPSEEEIVAQAGNLRGAGDSVYTVFTNADMPYPQNVKLPSGEVIPRLDAAAYTKYRASANRADRDVVFEKFWGAFQDYKRTLATTLYAAVKSHMFTKEVRHFDSCLEASLFNNNIPASVYNQLISDVHANLPTLQRYLKLRQRMMGVDQLRYEDLYAPIVKDVEMTYTPEQAMDLTLKACAPLGKDYVDTLRKGYESRWVDFLPSTGKKSGAYSNGAAYDVHPYQLLNFMGQYEDVSTLAHESGHSMHSYLSNTHQPYVTHDYSIFVAEVASTLNENLLLHYMLDHTKDDATRLYLLGTYLDSMRQTLFRQTLFAEFELRIHQMAEKGEPLSGDNLNALYLSLLKEYYGDAQGACKISDLYAAEWAYIPHFYMNFYVYQYATSLTASSYLAATIREEEAKKPPVTKTRDAYLQMLSKGSSEYPIDELKGAGVDMTTSAPFDAAMKEMNKVMNEMEKILDRQAKEAGGAKK